MLDNKKWSYFFLLFIWLHAYKTQKNSVKKQNKATGFKRNKQTNSLFIL